VLAIGCPGQARRRKSAVLPGVIGNLGGEGKPYSRGFPQPNTSTG
jgi:hypothetical protein